MKKTLMLSGLLGLAILVVPTANQAQITAKNGGYLFRIKHVKGDKATYKGTISTTLGGMQGQKPQSMDMQMTMSQVVKAVANGVATVEVTSSMTGMPMNDGKPNTMTIKVDNRGKSVGGGTNLPTSYGLPEGPVKVGQSWNMDQEMGAAMPGTKMKATYKLIAVRNQNGRQVAELAMTTTASGESMSGNGTGTIFLRMSDGSLQSINMKMNMKMGGRGQSMSVATNMNMQRTN